jgi:hypothetical protein
LLSEVQPYQSYQWEYQMSDAKESVRKFLSGEGVDHLGRSRDSILAWSNEELESTHDFIQWLFPIETISQFHQMAPTPTVEEFKELRKDAMVYIGLLRGLVRMLQFYGLEWGDQVVVKSHEWKERSEEWAWRTGHNDLRITRILHSLTLFGFDTEAHAFLNTLNAIMAERPQNEKRIESFEYWRNAVIVV